MVNSSPFQTKVAACLAISLVLGLGELPSTPADARGARAYAARSYASDVPRDSHCRIRRSRAERDAFERANPCPSTGRPRGSCPGYVVDHVIALKRGGPDDPSNMQWQTREAAAAKDKIE